METLKSQREERGDGRKVTIIVNQKRHRVDKHVLTADKIRDLANAPKEYEVWQVVGRPDPEGQLPIDDIQITDKVKVKNGDRFRVVPPGTFGGL